MDPSQGNLTGHHSRSQWRTPAVGSTLGISVVSVAVVIGWYSTLQEDQFPLVLFWPRSFVHTTDAGSEELYVSASMRLQGLDLYRTQALAQGVLISGTVPVQSLVLPSCSYSNEVVSCPIICLCSFLQALCFLSNGQDSFCGLWTRSTNLFSKLFYQRFVWEKGL